MKNKLEDFLLEEKFIDVCGTPHLKYLQNDTEHYLKKNPKEIIIHIRNLRKKEYFLVYYMSIDDFRKKC